MDLRRLRAPDYVAGLFGIVLLLSLWAPWYTLADGDLKGWQALRFVDLWLTLTAALAVGIVVVTATRDAPALPVAFDVLTAWAALMSIVLVAWRIVFEPGDKAIDGREWGLIVAAAGVIGVFAGAWWAMRKQDAPGMRPPPEPRRMPSP